MTTTLFFINYYLFLKNQDLMLVIRLDCYILVVIGIRDRVEILIAL